MTLLSLIAVLAAPAAAQNLRPTLVAPTAPTVNIAPVLPSLTLSPSLSAPVLPLLAPTLTPALPQAAVPALTPQAAAKASPAAQVAAIAQAAAPALSALASPSIGAAGMRSSGQALEDALTGRSSASPVNGALPTARSAPAVPGVVYARAVSPRHKAVLDESLKRRKAGWFRALTRMGVTLEGPVAPAFRVTEAKDISSKLAAVVTATEFTVQWTQGPTRAGSFKAVIPKGDPEPELRRLPDPAVPDAKLVLLRFTDKTPEADIKALLEANGLRLVSRGWGETPWTVAVTGRARAAAVAKKLDGVGIVLAASPKAASFAAADQLLLAFKTGSQPAFGRLGLTLIEKTRDGLWRVGVKAGTASKALAALAREDAVLYARPLEADLPESGQAVVTVRGGEAELKALLARHGLTVLQTMGERTYKVAGAADRAALAADAAVEASAAVGSLPDAAVDSAAAGTASYKGRPWSSTEYNLNWAMGYDSLARRGATAAQLARYEALCAAAPVRGGGFNPWSGD